MRAIFIEPEHQRITELAFGEGVKKRELFRAIQAQIGVGTFTVLNIEDGNTLYIDDEGLLKDPEFFFAWGDYPQPLAGNGLILGLDEEGDDIDATLSLDAVAAKVKFVRAKVEGFTQAEGWVDHPTLGRCWAFQGQVVLVPRPAH